MLHLHPQMDTSMNIQPPTVTEQIKVQSQMFEECLCKRRTTSEPLGGPSGRLFSASDTSESRSSGQLPLYSLYSRSGQLEHKRKDEAVPGWFRQEKLPPKNKENL